MSEDTAPVVPTARNDWGQRETRELVLQFVDRALNHGITSFFLGQGKCIRQRRWTNLQSHLWAAHPAEGSGIEYWSSLSVCLSVRPSVRLAGWLAGWLASWLAGWLALCLSVWLSGSLALWLSV